MSTNPLAPFMSPLVMFWHYTAGLSKSDHSPIAFTVGETERGEEAITGWFMIESQQSYAKEATLSVRGGEICCAVGTVDSDTGLRVFGGNSKVLLKEQNFKILGVYFNDFEISLVQEIKLEVAVLGVRRHLLLPYKRRLCHRITRFANFCIQWNACSRTHRCHSLAVTGRSRAKFIFMRDTKESLWPFPPGLLFIVVYVSVMAAI